MVTPLVITTLAPIHTFLPMRKGILPLRGSLLVTKMNHTPFPWYNILVSAIFGPRLANSRRLAYRCMIADHWHIFSAQSLANTVVS